MIACLDLRNGYLSLGIRKGGAWLCRKRLGVSPGRTVDDYALLFSTLASVAGVGKGGVEKAILSSVVPGMTLTLKAALHEVFGLEPLVLGPGLKTGLKIRTDNPAELGADLVCLGVAAHNRYAKDLIIIEAGSCLTFSALSAQGEFLGAAIAPSMEGAARALREGAAQLPEVGIAKAGRYIGKNTAAALASGIVHGYQGLIDRMVEGMAAELGEEVVIVGSGIEEKPLLEPSAGFDHYDPWLSLEGLFLISERN